MSEWTPSPYRDYRWIIRDDRLLGGKFAVRDTRLSVAFVLGCISEGMSADEISATYGEFPREAIAEIMKLSSELVDSANVAA